MIKLKSTAKGLLRGEFVDRSGQQVSVQEASTVEEPCVWIGVDVDMHGSDAGVYMKLNQQMVHDLLPMLRYFARTGGLGYDDPKDAFQVGRWVRGIGESNSGVEGRIIVATVGESLSVQDSRRPGEEGVHHCAWKFVDLIWEPINTPDHIPSRYDLLLSQDEDDDE